MDLLSQNHTSFRIQNLLVIGTIHSLFTIADHFLIIIVIFLLFSEYPQKNCILGLLLHLFDFLNMCCHVHSEDCICFC
jgi:ABC-type polysaccharide/polyol phosphate export permease